MPTPAFAPSCPRCLAALEDVADDADLAVLGRCRTHGDVNSGDERWLPQPRICDGCGEGDSKSRGPVAHPPGAGAIRLHAGCAPRRGPGTREKLRRLGHAGTITALLDTPDYGPVPLIAFDDMPEHPEACGWDDLED